MSFLGDPLLGREVGGYQLQTALGHGNMARAYRGVASDGSVAAVKVMRPELLSEPELLARFRREFETTVGLSHPNVVQTRGAGVHDDLPYLVLEFLEGRTLARLREDESPLALLRAVDLCGQIALGLAAAHASGVVHRDLKPENVMVLAGDQVKIFDFGLAAPRSSMSPRLTAQDMRLGTPMFMAPEYIAKGHIDHRTDLYALGVVLFELVTGDEPFHGPPYKVMHQQVTVSPPRASTLRPEVPAGLDALIDRLLAKDPAARPQTAEAVAEILYRAG